MSKKLFTPEDISNQTWDALEVARQDRARFREMLKEMSQGALVRLAWDYQESAVQLKTPAFLKHVDPELSEDGIFELANWVVGQGKQYYADVFEHPEKMPATVDSHDPAVSIYSDIVSEYRERYNEPVPSFSG